MAEFMVEHSNLAKNIIPNCSQGKATSKRLWEQLTVTLNSYGPPLKDSKSWRKVFSDQKFNAKKKISFNKVSKKKTGGGPYEEMVLTTAEEQLVQASGMDVAVEGLSSVMSFGKPKPINENEDEINETLQVVLENEDSDEATNDYVEKEKPRQNEKNTKKPETKLTFLKTHIQNTEELQRDTNSKHDLMVNVKEKSFKIKERLVILKEKSLRRKDYMIRLKERSLKIKEEEHTANMAIKKIDLEIKVLELEMLKQKQL